MLVRIRAVSLNYRDLLTVKGGYGSRQKLPLIPLSDGAGIVEAVGSGATLDKVIGSFFENWIGGRPSKDMLANAL